MTTSILNKITFFYILIFAFFTTSYATTTLLRKLLAEDLTKEPISINTDPLICTWSDELGCYLDYFDRIPENGIKSYYRQDEACSKHKEQAPCDLDDNCEWIEGCYAIIKSDELQKCADNSNPEPGSLCSFFKDMDTCRKKDQSEADCVSSQEPKCDWKKPSCLLHFNSSVQLEFQSLNMSFIQHVLDINIKCDTSTSRETCEEDVS